MVMIPTLLLGLGGLLFDIAPTPVPRDGISLGVTTETAVSMDAEVVVITVHPDHAYVHATFSMRNTGRKTESLEVGFPGAARPGSFRLDDAGVTVLDWQGPKLEQFQAKVDGKHVKAICKQPPGTERAFEQEGVSSNWYLWPMTFEGSQRRKVEVSYRVRTRDGNYTPEGILKHRKLTYILKTGRGWAGPIGSAEIIARFADGLTSAHAPKVSPGPTKSSDKTITWRFERFEPDTDIVIEYSIHRNAADALKVFEKGLVKTPDDLGLLIDVAVSREELRRHVEAASAWIRVVDLAGNADTTASIRGGYIPAEHHAARLYRQAGKPELARPVAARGARRLERFLERIRAEQNTWWILNKMYRTNDEALGTLLKEMRSWSKAPTPSGR